MRSVIATDLIFIVLALNRPALWQSHRIRFETLLAVSCGNLAGRANSCCVLTTHPPQAVPLPSQGKAIARWVSLLAKLSERAEICPLLIMFTKIILTFLLKCDIPYLLLHKSNTFSPEWAFLSLVKMHAHFSACSS